MQRITAQTRRGLSSLAVKASGAGPAVKVLKVVPSSAPLPALGAKDVGLKFLLSPIHKADIRVAESAPPAFLGQEGLAEVTEVGSSVTSLKKGDWVVPPLGFGCWRSTAVASESALYRVPSDIPAPYAATLVGDLATAYRLLNDNGLKKGDVIMQNDATSSVGLAVLQIAREMGIKTVNVIDSSMPEADNALKLLTNLGGDINITDAYVNSYGFNELLKELPPCKLALNGGVEGDVVTHMSRSLSAGAIVTYSEGAPAVVVPPEFLDGPKKLSLKTFSIGSWYASKTPVDRAVMFADIAHLVRANKLTLFYQLHDFDDFSYALEAAVGSGSFRKVLVNQNFPDRLAEHDALSQDKYAVFETTV